MHICYCGPIMNVCDNAWYLLYNLINKMSKKKTKTIYKYFNKNYFFDLNLKWKMVR